MPGSGSSERSSPQLETGGSWGFAKDNFLVSVLTSTHTREGTEAAREGAPGRGHESSRAGGQQERLRRPRAGGSRRMGGSSGSHFLRHISDI